MKRLFAFVLAGLLCFGAAAQESNILQDWEEKIEGTDDGVVTPFSYINVLYCNNLAAPEGYSRHGWGLEFSTLHLGFNPWKNGRFSVGLLDVALDFGYLVGNYQFISTLDGKIVTSSIAPAGNKSQFTNVAFLFPVSYIQNFGDSKWSAALQVSPGVGISSFTNENVVNNIRTKEKLNYSRGGGYFRLNLCAMIWYDNFGFVVRYGFPRGFQGAGVISAGLSFRL